MKTRFCEHNIYADEIAGFIRSKFGWANPYVTLLAGDGSDRVYFRVCDGSSSMVVMLYGTEKAENDYFMPIHGFLSGLGVSIPEIIFKDEAKRLLYLEDLGDGSLYSIFRKIDDGEKLRIYKSVIDESSKIFYDGYESFKNNPFVISDGFSKNLYDWEHQYFADNYILNYRKLSMGLSALHTQFENLTRILLSMENRLIHRDLQSKNVMVKDGNVYLIDFQGMRFGLPEYDIASLLKDPYVDLSDGMIDELFDYYAEKRLSFSNKLNKKEISYLFSLCSIQRLLQATGAYCFLGLAKGKTQFFEYIKPAEKKLIKELSKTNILPELIPILEYSV